jgi:hypothetical protein
MTDYTPPILGTIQANLMLTKVPTVQVRVFKFDSIRQEASWVTKSVRTFKTKTEAMAFIDRIQYSSPPVK